MYVVAQVCSGETGRRLDCRATIKQYRGSGVFEETPDPLPSPEPFELAAHQRLELCLQIRTQTITLRSCLTRDAILMMLILTAFALGDLFSCASSGQVRGYVLIESCAGQLITRRWLPAEGG